VFAGYRRTRTGFPVEYPTASSPQAWATGTPFVFLRTMLGLEPQGSRLRAEPVLPPEVSQLELRAIPFREDRVDVTSSREEAQR
jgi:glycogen debranching enzyme